MLNTKKLRELRKHGYFDHNEFPYQPDPLPEGNWVLALVLGSLTLLIILFFWCGCAKAEIEPKQPVLPQIRAIIGEAEGEGYEGMLAVAGALRNRGTLAGVYGLHSYRVKHLLYSRHTLVLATLAWKESEYRDVTGGATGWGNERDLVKFCSEDWWRHCMITTRIGGQWFYKEVK